jgi:hypothetical protein
MRRTLAKAIVVIAEAGIDLLAERIKKCRKGNGRYPRRIGRGAYGVGDRSVAHSVAAGGRRAVKKKRTCRRSISWKRQNTKNGGRAYERKW